MSLSISHVLMISICYQAILVFSDFKLVTSDQTEIYNNSQQYQVSYSKITVYIQLTYIHVGYYRTISITNLSTTGRVGGFFKMMNFSPIYLCPSLLLLNFEKTAMRLRLDKITKGVRLIPNVPYIVIYYQVSNSSCTLRITGSKIGDWKSF